MKKRQIFYSFHFKNDVMRVQQIRNIGTFEGNSPVSHQEWETVKKGGDKAIEKWIDENMNYRSCVVVLIGEETSKRPWVEYEIKKAWKEKRGLLGIHIHNLKCPNAGKGVKGDRALVHKYFPDAPTPYADFLGKSIPYTNRNRHAKVGHGIHGRHPGMRLDHLSLEKP